MYLITADEFVDLLLYKCTVLTFPVDRNLPGENPRHPEERNLFSYESGTRNEPTISEVQLKLTFLTFHAAMGYSDTNFGNYKYPPWMGKLHIYSIKEVTNIRLLFSKLPWTACEFNFFGLL